MDLETGKFFEKNHKRLDSLANNELEWALALKKCQKHIIYKIGKKTLYGAHTVARLGVDPIEYYINYAYDAILSGRWEWKESNSLSDQLILIADSTISTEVEKTKTGKATYEPHLVNLDLTFYDLVDPSYQLDASKEVLFNAQIKVVEECIKGDEDLEIFWECTKDGMKRVDIAEFMEKTTKQVDKIREKFVKKIKASSYFQID